MRTKVVHCKKEPYDIYIGRPSMWGNPFSHKGDTLARYRVNSVQEAIWEYERYLRHQLRSEAIIWSDIEHLYGKTLGCWCKPGPCHGDILVEYADRANKGNYEQI
jgi:hypothetical protein